jgi:hypothetical protein
VYWQPEIFNPDTNTYKDDKAPCLMYPGELKGKYDRCDSSRIKIPNTGGNDEPIANVTAATVKQAGTDVWKKCVASTTHGIHIDLGESGDQPLYQHQCEVVDKFKHKRERALFMEMGTGKSRAILEIAARKQRRQELERTQ